MNDKLQNILTELAEKFGTTVEHLWSVMLKQAYISGVFDLVQIGLTAIVVFLVIKYARWFSSKEKESLDFMSDVGHPMALGFAFIGVFILCCVALSSIYDAMTAFGNPEFWALKQILK